MANTGREYDKGTDQATRYKRALMGAGDVIWNEKGHTKPRMHKRKDDTGTKPDAKANE